MAAAVPSKPVRCSSTSPQGSMEARSNGHRFFCEPGQDGRQRFAWLEHSHSLRGGETVLARTGRLYRCQCENEQRADLRCDTVLHLKVLYRLCYQSAAG